MDERRELAIDERNGMKNYIASEDLGITTSSGLVRNLFGQCIDLARKYKHSKDEKDFFEALRLLGTGCHCLEDFSAHSNYTELALIEMGERDIFPHVGRRTQMQIRGARDRVFPLITGTFGGVDFLHSVMGEFSDKATQSELEELEGAISHAKNSDTSLLKDILSKIPSGVFGGGNDDPASKADELQANSNAAHMENMRISPKEPEAFTKQVNDIMKQIYPIIEFHDNIMKGISSAIDKIPILPDLIEQLQDQVNLFVFSLLAPYIMPIISQVKNELHTGSSEVIKSSQEHQMAVFSNDEDTDPTHSMLSKDHFSNVLNEPAGKVASAVLKWVVPQIVECWDDDNADIARTLDRIVNGVLHHPSLRGYGDDGAHDGRGLMFREVEKWWNDKDDRERDDLRRSLSREGVQHFKNHKEGVKDKGHGCGKPLGLPTSDTYQSSGATGGKSSDAGNLLGGIASALGNSSGGSGGSGNYGGGYNNKQQEQISDKVSEAVGGGAIGSIVGGFASNILGNAAKSSDRKSNQSSEYGQESSYNSGNQSSNSYGSNQQSSGYGQSDSYNSSHQSGNSHGSNQQSGGYGQQSSYNSGNQGSNSYGSNQQSSGYQEPQRQSGYGSSGRTDQYGQDSLSGRTGYDSQQSNVSRPSHESRHDQASERRHESDNLIQNTSFGGRTNDHRQTQHGSSRRDDSDDDDSDDDDDYEKKQRKREKKEQKRLKKQREEEEKRSSRRDDYGSSSRRDDDYPSQQPAYGQQQNYSSGHGRQSESSYSQSSRHEQTSSSSYGTSSYEQSSSSGYPSNTYSSSERYESSTPSYGGNSHSSSEYPGNAGRTSGGGYGSTTSGYGGESQGHGGNTQSSYGNESRHHGSSERREGHGRRDEYGDSGSADMPGSFGGGESYGEDRRRNDGGGYGSSGYGGNSGGYGSRY